MKSKSLRSYVNVVRHSIKRKCARHQQKQKEKYEISLIVRNNSINLQFSSFSLSLHCNRHDSNSYKRIEEYARSKNNQVVVCRFRWRRIPYIARYGGQTIQVHILSTRLTHEAVLLHLLEQWKKKLTVKIYMFVPFVSAARMWVALGNTPASVILISIKRGKRWRKLFWRISPVIRWLVFRRQVYKIQFICHKKTSWTQ